MSARTFDSVCPHLRPDLFGCPADVENGRAARFAGELQCPLTRGWQRVRANANRAWAHRVAPVPYRVRRGSTSRGSRYLPRTRAHDTAPEANQCARRDGSATFEDCRNIARHDDGIIGARPCTLADIAGLSVFQSHRAWPRQAAHEPCSRGQFA